MLMAVTLVEQWEGIEARLPAGWEEIRLAFAAGDVRDARRAAPLLGPLGPGRADGRLVFSVLRRRSPGPETARRLLALLDEAGIGGRLELLQAVEAEPEGAGERGPRPPLAEAWDDLVRRLPPDWSDLLCAVELSSSDDLAPAALELAPLNPSRHGPGPAFRFRVARRFGYGAAPQVARRCLARLDERGIPGRLHLLHSLSATDPVATQGPVWHLAGKAV